MGSVWWDRAGLRAGDRFSETTTALDAAKAVVVVWTHGAVASDWVYAEATPAQRPAVLDAIAHRPRSAGLAAKFPLLF